MDEGTTSGATGGVGDRLTFTVDEVARMLGISRSGAYDSIARGEIPSLHIGRRVLVPREPLLDFVRSARRRARPDDPWGRGKL